MKDDVLQAVPSTPRCSDIAQRYLQVGDAGALLPETRLENHPSRSEKHRPHGDFPQTAARDPASWPDLIRDCSGELPLRVNSVDDAF